MRKLTLEERITRLERLVNKSKNESSNDSVYNNAMIRKIMDAIGEWMDAQGFDSNDLDAIAKYRDMESFRKIYRYLVNDAGFDKGLIHKWRYHIEDLITTVADKKLGWPNTKSHRNDVPNSWYV